MPSLLKSTYNTRYLMEDNKKYIRSDRLYNLTDADINWLKDNNYRTIIDLRGKDEINNNPCSLSVNKDFIYKHMPVTIGNIIDKQDRSVSDFYIDMLDDNMQSIIEAIESATTGVAYFCSLGKDRTGVVSALLLQRAGYSKEYIINNYALTQTNLKDVIPAIAKEFNIDVNTPLLLAKAEFMEEFLSKYE